MTHAPTDWIDRFAGLSRLPDDLKTALTRGARIETVPAGGRLFGPGEAREVFLLLDGELLVRQVTEAGREIHLYRVHAGESCVICAAAMLLHAPQPVEGIAQTALLAAVIPQALFDRLTEESPVFRAFVFQAFARRLSDMVALVDQLTTRRLDGRLAARVLEIAGPEGEAAATHQALAAELGTAREVVSRLLADFARSGWIETGRGRLRVLDRGALDRLARRG